MGRARDEESLKISWVIMDEVGKRPCLYDSDHPFNKNRRSKNEAWEEVCRAIVPRWSSISSDKKAEEVRKIRSRWRSIRDCYTKSFKQGAHIGADDCPVNSRRHQKHLKMTFLRNVLIKREKRLSKENNSVDKSSDFSKSFIDENSNSKERRSSSPSLLVPPIIPSLPTPSLSLPFSLKYEIDPEPLNLSLPKNRDELPLQKIEVKKEKQTVDREQLTETLSKEEKEIQTDETILEIDNINDIKPEEDLPNDRLFMDRILPLIRNLDDEAKLHFRTQMLKLIKNTLDGRKTTVKCEKPEKPKPVIVKQAETTLSMTTRSADGSRTERKRKIRSPSPTPLPLPKKRGPGRPRKIRPPEEEVIIPPSRKRFPRLKVSPIEVSKLTGIELSLSKATSLTDLTAQEFMKVWNLQRAQTAPPILQTVPEN